MWVWELMLYPVVLQRKEKEVGRRKRRRMSLNSSQSSIFGRYMCVLLHAALCVCVSVCLSVYPRTVICPVQGRMASNLGWLTFTFDFMKRIEPLLEGQWEVQRVRQVSA